MHEQDPELEVFGSAAVAARLQFSISSFPAEESGTRREVLRRVSHPYWWFREADVRHQRVHAHLIFIGDSKAYGTSIHRLHRKKMARHASRAFSLLDYLEVGGPTMWGASLLFSSQMLSMSSASPVRFQVTLKLQGLV